MLTVLHVSAAGERGGLETILLNLVRSLDPARVTSLALFLADGPFVRDVEAAGIEVHLSEAGRVRNVLRGGRVVAHTVRLIRRRGVDLVHTYNAKAHLYGGLAAALTRVPCVYHLGGLSLPGPSREGLISLLAIGLPARRTTVVSQYVADTIRPAWRTKREIAVIHTGVALEAFGSPDGLPTARAELGIGDDAPVVAMACRLQEGKGVHVFLDAAVQVARAAPAARFLVVGGALFGLEQDYGTRLREQADRAGLAAATIFTGFRPDVYRFLAGADVIVHGAIRPDAFPTVLLEAMALGKPVVATDLGGPREIVEDGVTGFLVPPAEPAPLARAILALLDDPALRRRMGDAGAARFRARFQAVRMAREFEALYEGAVRDGGGRVR